MNVQPHTHEPTIARRYSFSHSPSWDNSWEVRYGDTTVRICNGRRMPTPEMVRKATAKAIRLHDEGSRRMGEIEQARYEAQRAALTVKSQWGAERR